MYEIYIYEIYMKPLCVSVATTKKAENAKFYEFLSSFIYMQFT